ncbi:hypothetical protein [Lactococcus petauri]|uniref:hypothetical protein n=1 Tax=Lactococcus petauri TaxID=1940789 RepID=UPI00254A034D|nr:hypothetical protein [Lactococcus petauri]
MVLNSNFTASDILDNDFDTIIGVINADVDKKEDVTEDVSEVMSLADFMNKI